MISTIGHFVLVLISRFGYAAHALISLTGASSDVLRRPRLVIKQLRSVGNDSFIIVAASGLFVDSVFGLQSYNMLNRCGSEQALGLLVALSLVCELGPVMTALLLAGCAGMPLMAEIGLMRAGEQLVVMETMVVDPLIRVLAPRFRAGFIAMSSLAVTLSAVGILGGCFVGVGLIGVDPSAFWSQMQAGVDVVDDVLNGVIKSLVFGMAVTLIALYQRYEAKATPKGISHATACTVMIALLTVLVLDFALTALVFN